MFMVVSPPSPFAERLTLWDFGAFRSVLVFFEMVNQEGNIIIYNVHGCVPEIKMITNLPGAEHGGGEQGFGDGLH